MDDCKHIYDSPVFDGQFISILEVKTVSHPKIRNPAQWVLCNIINKYNTQLEAIDCYENTISVITSDADLQRNIEVSARKWIDYLLPEPQRPAQSKYRVEGSGLLNTNQLMEILQQYCTVVDLAPHTCLDHKKSNTLFANSAIVTVEGSRKPPT